MGVYGRVLSHRKAPLDWPLFFTKVAEALSIAMAPRWMNLALFVRRPTSFPVSQ